MKFTQRCGAMRAKVMTSTLATVAATAAILTVANTAQARGLDMTPDPARAGIDAAAIAQVGDAVQKHIDNGDVPGAVTLVARNGRVAWFDARGKLDATTAMRKDTVFWAASMTKPVIATAIMMMVEAGKVKLDDPVSKFIPEFAAPMRVRVLKAGSPPPSSAPNAPKPEYDLVPAQRPITVQDLLSHTAGLQAIGVANDSLPAIQPGDTPATYVPKLAQATLEFQPGSRWAYSNATGFDVLVRIVEVASGQPFAEFARQRIFKPLGMTSTSFGPQASLAARTMTLPPALADNPCVNGKTYPCGSAGLWTDAEDYARFAQMLLDGGKFDGKRLLKSTSVRQIATNHTGTLYTGTSGVPGGDKGVGFGYSVIVVQDHDKAGLAVTNGSYGWDGVGTRRFWVVPDEHVVIVMLVPSGSAAALHRDVERAAMAAVK